MTNLESLRSLQKRIREAKGIDRRLDADICASLRFAPDQSIGHYISKFPVWRGRKDGRVEVVHDNGDGGAHFWAPELTLDPDGLGPCVALQRAVLPGWSLCLTVGLSGDYAVIHEFDPPCRRLPSEPFSFRSYNICLTALDAILSALIAQEEAKERVG